MTPTVKATRGFFHVTLGGHTVVVPRGIGQDRLNEEQAVAKAQRIIAARKVS